MRFNLLIIVNMVVVMVSCFSKGRLKCVVMVCVFFLNILLDGNIIKEVVEWKKGKVSFKESNEYDCRDIGFLLEVIRRIWNKLLYFVFEFLIFSGEFFEDSFK